MEIEESAKNKPFVAIIGDRNSGKSTIIRSLTGANTSQYRGAIVDKSTQKTIEVIGSSPQEIALSLANLQTILSKAASNADCNGVVCALQPNNPRKRLSMEDVLKEAKKYRFQVHAYILDPGYSGINGQKNQVSQRLAIAGFSSCVLDGQRFAQINAETINSCTHIAA